MIRIVLSFPDDTQTELLLEGVPRVGESIRLANGRAGGGSLIVTHVTWLEGTNLEPSVLVSVRKRDGKA